ncbi:MAG: integration host factor subunit beta [Sulfurihydrogenibium sp.]|jgi:DNA-binding protein HU-beta|nr:integration host factor subunit beta [Sulfurihydrogenibium sp.]
MTKYDLVQATRKQFNDVSPSQVSEIIDYVFEVMTRTIASGERVTIPGLGVFGVKERRARKGRNPRTGEEIVIPAKKVVVFKPAMSLKMAINKR